MSAIAMFDTPDATGGGAPVLDPATLNLNTMSNPPLQRELFDLYFEQAPSLFQKMVESLQTGDRAPWRLAAHSLKGTARTLGLMKLGDVAAQAEASPPNQPALDALRDACAEAFAASHAYLRDAEFCG